MAHTLPKSTSEQRAEAGQESSAWLVELGPACVSVPTYWGDTRDAGEVLGWTTNIDKAMRFARKQDAELYIEDSGWTEAVAVEHMWCGPATHEAVAVPRGLLEHCLGVIQEAAKHMQMSQDFAEDVALAIAQLRAHARYSVAREAAKGEKVD